MKTVRHKVLALAAAAILAPALLLAAAATSTTPQVQAHRGFAQHMAQQLGLSADQTQQVQAIMANHKAEMSAQMTQLKTARTALFDAIHADTFDENAVRAASANVAQVEADLAVSRAKMASEVRNVLTPDQQAKAKELMANFRARSGKAGAHMHGRTMDPLGGS